MRSRNSGFRPCWVIVVEYPPLRTSVRGLRLWTPNGQNLGPGKGLTAPKWSIGPASDRLPNGKTGKPVGAKCLLPPVLCNGRLRSPLSVRAAPTPHCPLALTDPSPPHPPPPSPGSRQSEVRQHTCLLVHVPGSSLLFLTQGFCLFVCATSWKPK